MEGALAPAPDEAPVGNLRVVHGQYFRAAGIRILAGRAFSPTEIREGSPNVVVNESLARTYWPNQDPLGRRIKLGGMDSDAPWRRVIGVARDVRHGSLEEEEARPGFYLTYGNVPLPTMTLLLRSSSDPLLLAEPLRKTIHRLAPTVPVSSLRTFEDYWSDASGQTRFYTFLVDAFSLAAIVLALLGVAGIMTLVVRSRTREMGIRTAVGAAPRNVMASLLLEGMRPVAMGGLLGSAMAFAILRALASSFYGVRALDPGIYAGLGALFLVTALAAVWLPSRQVLREDPAKVLREE